MKLWSAIFVICLLASTVQGVFAVKGSGTDTGSGIISEAPLNQEYIDYKNTPRSPEWVKQIISEDQLGYIPSPADNTHLKGKKVSKKALEAEVQGISDVPAGDVGEITSAPATYDLRTAGRVSPVKNQGSCGSCWAFASYGSMESEVLPTQLWDFSENNLKNTHGFDYASCSGGNAQMATAYLTRWSGAVAEADDPYVASSTSSPTSLPVKEHAQEILMIPGRSGSLDNDNIKAALQTTGALYTTMYWSDTYYNTLSKAYYYSGTSGSNHAVTIVGWDDTYSRTNFITAAPGDGAFIIKNSWGTSWGNNGYFYLSYYDSQVGKTLTAFTGESVANYAHIYQYDPLGWISSMGYGSNTAWAANVFSATTREAVSAVGLSTNQVNTAYQIFIYTNPTQGPLNSAGPVSTTQGTIGIPGYHTVTLPTPVTVNAGEKFSVVVRFQTPSYMYPIPIERPLSGYSGQATASAGQSYISSTGTTWTDLTTRISNANACLKAYTVNTGTSVPAAAFSATPTSGKAPLTVAFTDQSTGTPATWAWSFGDGGSSSEKNPSHIYNTAGTYTVSLTVTNSGGSSTRSMTNFITVAAPTPTPSITVTAPNSGESWVLGSNHAITWTSSGDVGSNLKIEVLKAGAVVQTLSASTPNDGSFSWTISTGLATGTDYRIRITSTTNTAITDTSNNNFTLTPAISTSSITVTAPNSGESWVLGSNHAITWTSSGDVGSNLKIEVLKAGAVVQTLSASTPNDGSFSWTISTGLATGTDYRIRITSTTNTAITDTSNNNFTLTPATSTSSITVTAPNGGESWVLGSNHAITWTSSGDVGSNLKIEVLKAGAVVQTLSASTPNDGSFSWTISTGLATGTDYRIRITSTTNTAITDTSNNNFTLTPATSTSSITVTAPNGGESWVLGSNHAITWTSSQGVGFYLKIEVLKAGAVVQTLSASTPNDGSFSWTISTGLATGTDYRIRITSTTNTAITDTSNNNFTLTS